MSSDPKTYIEFITGPMFSGKTTRLLKIATQLKNEGKSVLLLKPAIDDRYAEDEIVSHNGEKLKATNVTTSNEIPELVADHDYIFVDEVQLFDSSLFENLQKINAKINELYCSGLDLDSNKVPFEVSEKLSKTATQVIKLNSKCDVCGSPAEFTYKKFETNEFVGGKEMYEPRCSNCYN